MHSCCLLITKEFPSDDVIQKILEPFNDDVYYSQPEDGRVRPAFCWDWYSVGGRFCGTVKLKVNPFSKDGPIINSAEMYCELTLPGRLIWFFCKVVPWMRSGGKPSLEVYSMSAPNSRRALTSTWIGRCCIRWVPVMIRFPGVTLK